MSGRCSPLLFCTIDLTFFILFYFFFFYLFIYLFIHLFIHLFIFLLLSIVNFPLIAMAEVYLVSFGHFEIPCPGPKTVSVHLFSNA